MTLPDAPPELPADSVAPAPDSAPASAAPLHPAPKKSSGIGRVLAAIVLMATGAALFAGGNALTQPSVAQDPAFQSLQARLQMLESAVTGLGQKIDAITRIQAAAPAVTPNAVTQADLDARIADAAKPYTELRAAVDTLAKQVQAQPAAPDLRGDLAALARRIDALQAAPVPASGGDGTLAAALAARMNDLNRQLEDLRNRPAPAATAAPDTQLRDTVAALAAGGNGSAALVAAAVRLQQRIHGSAPFAPELGAVRDLAKSGGVADPDFTAALGVLTARADRGVPSADDLARSFAPLVGPALAAEAGAAPGWAGAIAQRLRGLVTVRRTGEVSGVTLDARLARTEARLARGDVAGALAELEGTGAPSLASWRSDAAARVAVEQAAAQVLVRAATGTAAR